MLELQNLTKKYNHIPVVNGVSFSISPGEILGYLGPNGAGKSTTVKMLAGLVEPSFGRILFQGKKIRDCMEDFRSRLGYVPEQCHIYEHLTAFEYLQLVGRLHDLPETSLEKKITALLSQFELYMDMHTPLSAFSKGMRQKVLISAALIHNPEILLLDEPLSGLDVANALVVRDVIRELQKMGKIILYSSHVLEVVEKVCSRVIIIDRGNIVAHDDVGNLRRLMELPDLESIFRELVVQSDTVAMAERITRIIAGDGVAKP